jgi:peroxiredoxin (alkyl hydroperoxide reductase subunit C)
MMINHPTDPALDPVPHPPALRLGDPAPDFQARTTQGMIRLSDYRGRWLVFFSHPADFTPVCTSEFVAIAHAADRFAALDCALLGLSVDSLHAHLAWVRAIAAHFAVTIPFAIVEDPSMAIGRAYGMIDANAADSAAMRASFFIDPEGIIRAVTLYPHTIGRSVDEMLRMVAALQRTARGDALAPEGWRPGDALLRPPPQDQQTALAGADEPWFCQTMADPQ